MNRKWLAAIRCGIIGWAGLCLCSLLSTSALAAAVAEGEETDLRVLRNLERFQDWKFGLFIHWGIYSQWGCIESWPLVEEDKWARPDDLPAWTERNKDFAKFSTDYVALNKTFAPKSFYPERWAEMAKEAGMRYVVFTTKHHDGFCMFDTEQTDYRSTHKSTPFYRDARANATKAVFDAFRREGFGIGAYYSKSDWHHPGYWAPEWPHKDRNVNYETSKYPEKWEGFVSYTHKLVEELMQGYGKIDILWLDGGQVRPPKQDIRVPELAAKARRYQPGLIIVDRTVGGRYENYRTPEQQVPEKPLPYVWETCMTMGDQWSYKPEDNYKSTHKLIHLLVDVVAKGGNFLLNIGPDADGQFPRAAASRLREIGEWMRINSEAIHDTRPLKPYKDGPVAFTHRGDFAYAIYLAPEDNAGAPPTITLGTLRPKAESRVYLLGRNISLPWRMNTDGKATIEIPVDVQNNPPCRHAYVFRFILEQ